MRSEILHLSDVSSTNTLAGKWVKEGKITKDTILHADYQSNGRGQGSHYWSSNKGENILASYVVFPEFLSVSRQFLLSKAVSIAIIDFLKQENITASIKWPNDILIDNHKLGGILIEHSIVGKRLANSIIGIGLNVNQVDFPEFPLKATSLRILLKRVLQLEKVLSDLFSCIEDRYHALKGGAQQSLDIEYLMHLFRLNESSRFEIDNEEIAGVIRGVNALGELEVETNKGLASYGFHTIRMLPDH